MYDEQSPLKPDGYGDEVQSKSGSSGGMIMMPAAVLMLVITLVSGVALALSFSETGHRDGYEEGKIDGADQLSGCQSLFYWLLIQFCLDLVITCLTCLVLMPPSISDTVGFFGCCASFRLCALAAGFHILYFSGLERDLCNQFLITWSTIITWLGIAIMGFVACHLSLVLFSGGSSARKVAKQPFATEMAN
jgi:hypothetical protein